MALNTLVSPAACVLLVNTGHPANGVIELALPQYAGQLSNRGADTEHWLKCELVWKCFKGTNGPGAQSYWIWEKLLSYPYWRTTRKPATAQKGLQISICVSYTGIYGDPNLKTLRYPRKFGIMTWLKEVPILHERRYFGKIVSPVACLGQLPSTEEWADWIPCVFWAPRSFALAGGSVFSWVKSTSTPVAKANVRSYI